MPRPRTLNVVIKVDTAALDRMRVHLEQLATERRMLANLAAEFETYAERIRAIMATTPLDVAELGRRASLLGARPPVEVDDPSLPCSAEVDWVPAGEEPGQHKPRTVFVATLKADAPIGSGQAGDPVPAIYYRMHDTCRAALADELTDEGLDPRPVVEPSDGEAIDREPRPEDEGERIPGTHPDYCGKATAHVTPEGGVAPCWLDPGHAGEHEPAPF